MILVRVFMGLDSAELCRIAAGCRLAGVRCRAMTYSVKSGYNSILVMGNESIKEVMSDWTLVIG
jgi:hypothetical protein